MIPGTYYFIEQLSLRVWFFSVWPRIIIHILFKRATIRYCYVFNSSPVTLIIAKTISWLSGTPAGKLDFEAEEVRDEDGAWIRTRILYSDLASVVRDIMSDTRLQALGEKEYRSGTFKSYLDKEIGLITPDMSSVWMALNYIQACVWKTDSLNNAANSVLFLGKRPWFDYIEQYANKYLLAIVGVRSPWRMRSFVLRCLPSGFKNILRDLRYRVFIWRVDESEHSYLGRYYYNLVKGGRTKSIGFMNSTIDQHFPRVSVEYWGQLNLSHPEHYSDLHFWQQSSLLSKDILLTIGSLKTAFNPNDLENLYRQDMGVVALHQGYPSTQGVPIFMPNNKIGRRGISLYKNWTARPEIKWIDQKRNLYLKQKAHWYEFFETYDVKVFSTWFKYNAAQFVINDALAELGGISTIYQRAYEFNASPDTRVHTDILFGFSSLGAEIERSSNSKILYHVTTGYLGDHRFPLLKKSADGMRKTLNQNGAKKILAFFDENSHDDGRFDTGHTVVQSDYSFLLNRVIENPNIGLILKPKVPISLRRRLGSVCELLDLALSTGRCMVLEGGDLQGSRTPAEAAMASDIAIHSSLIAATAAVEAVLSGTPTLLMDHAGWPSSPLYALGEGIVVFKDWTSLWDACLEFMADSNAVNGFGDWSIMKEELDPFRDGQAARRMGTYVKWLIDGYKEGLDRQTIMDDAAHRYCELWGWDKIKSINESTIVNPSL